MRGERSKYVLAGLAVALAAPMPAGAAGDRAFGEYLAGECATCHKPSGRGGDGIPSIVNIPEDKFTQALKDYRAKERPNPVMQNIASRLKDEEIAALATYYASLAPATERRKQ